MACVPSFVFVFHNCLSYSTDILWNSVYYNLDHCCVYYYNTGVNLYTISQDKD